MIAKINPSKISGTINAPTSKSSMQRACAAALLNEGITIIENPGNSNDDVAALSVSKSLGATIVDEKNGNKIITGSKLLNAKTSNTVEAFEAALNINCGESGLGIRMFAALAALSNKEVCITGTGSLLSRPMIFFDEIFPQLCINIQSNNGKLPIKIKGPLQPKNISIDGSLSSQFLTGLLMAFGKAATEPVTITVNNLKSKPYIDLTLQVMKNFGYDVINNNYESFLINPVKQDAKTIHYKVEGDWSGAAFLLVAGAINGNITVTGLDVFSTQADKAILKALMDCGCTLSVMENEINIANPQIKNSLKPFHFNATDCPDLFPPLVALAAACSGTSVIEGVSRLAHKESDRGLTLQQEFSKMGVSVKLQDDLMLIEGGAAIQAATVHSHHDHRIAMACAVAGLIATGEIIIEEADAINKSYPDFFENLKSLGASLSLTENNYFIN